MRRDMGTGPSRDQRSGRTGKGDSVWLLRALGVFERSYGVSSADFYRAHTGNDTFAEGLPTWHREVWAGTYRQWLHADGATDAQPGADPPSA
jgi:hypothetical protein